MRFTARAILVLLSSFTIVGVHGQESQLRAARTLEQIQTDVAQLRRDTKANADDIAVARRDQINYRVEKDLLKEAYASNLQSINLIIAIVFGVVTLVGGLLGYVGVKNIRELKADYAKELENLRTVKDTLEQEFEAFKEKQKAVESQVVDLAKINEEQDRRLKVLELTEKAAQYMDKKVYYWALEFTNAALTMDPDNLRLHNMRAVCLGKLGNFDSMIEANKKILEKTPEDKQIIANIGEALILSSKFGEYDVWYTQHKDTMDAHSNGALVVFLKTVAAILKGNLADAKHELAPFVAQCANGAAPRLGTWGFDEANLAISRLANAEAKALAINVARFFKGEVPKEAIEVVIRG